MAHRRAGHCDGWAPLAVAAGAGALGALAVSAIAKQVKVPDKSVRGTVDVPYPAGGEQFVRTMGSLLKPPILAGNRVTTLMNGDQIFPEMLAAIHAARASVTMETFIYWSGRMGRAFGEALADRARAGVECHVLLDWLGSNRLDRASLARMIDAGVRVSRYHRHVWQVGRLNHRTHRKLLVIDGTVAFTGGVGIADVWMGDAEDPDHWRDNHYKVEGPVVAQLQSAFTDNWLKSDHVVLHDGRYFPRLAPAGDLACQAFQSSPEEGSESMRLMFLLAIAAARRSIKIATAYFVPDPISVRSLADASRRGVAVEIMVPGRHIDTTIVRYASRSCWGDLLAAGVRIYEYAPTMFHCKAIVVDGVWTSIGSTNFDNRSFRLNDEANLNVYDAGFAAGQTAWFDADRARCRETTLDQWDRRGVARKVKDFAAGTLASQL